VLERLGVPAQACVFVDDVDVNVAAARELGFAVVHFRDTGQAIAELDRLLGAPDAQLSEPSRSQQ
jgi:putative hydrolase of the HAD superfamily